MFQEIGLSLFRIASAFVVAALLSGCEEEGTQTPVEVVKSIKTYVVTEPASGNARSYSGTLAASDTSSLSFGVGGTVQTVLVAQGDAVTKGQSLATLDPEPFELDVNAARAELDGAQSDYTEKQAEVARQRQLFQKGWVSKAAVEQAISAADGTTAQLEYARSRLSIAERNLRSATLTSPFDGKIASREIDPFQEVNAGQSLFLINSDGALDIDILVSDSVINRINLGASVDVDVSNLDGCGCTARITEIGTASGTANTVPVKASLLDGPDTLLPGMNAQVSISLGSNTEEKGFLVPLTAIAPGDGDVGGYVFLFDSAESVVRKTPITSADGVAGNLVAVQGALGAGDLVAAAGVSFLRDGQRVKLLGE